MEINQIKLERQLLGRDIWFNNNCDGILDYAPGVGKTYTTFLCLKALENIKRHSYLIVVPGAELVKQWEDKLVLEFPKYFLDRIFVKTVQTLLSENNSYEVDVLVIDEIHEFTSEERLKVINGTLVKCKHFLGLSGTTTNYNFRSIIKYHKIIDTITIEEAKEKGFVADFVEYNMGLALTEKEVEKYNIYTNRISDNLPKFNNDLALAQKIITGGYDKHKRYFVGASWARSYAYSKGWKENLNMSLEQHQLLEAIWNPNTVIGYARSLLTAIRSRKELLNLAESKYIATLDLVNKFNKVKTIIFSESTEFADIIGDTLNKNNHPTVIYHSNLQTKIITSDKTGKLIKFGKTRLKTKAIADIKTGKARVLSTAKSLDRGLDIEDLRFGITTSGTQNATQYKQRRGRTGRKEANIFGDVPVLLVNLFIADTQDEKWLRNRQKDSVHEIIWVTTIDDISYTPPPNIEFTIKDL